MKVMNSDIAGIALLLIVVATVALLNYVDRYFKRKDKRKSSNDE